MAAGATDDRRSLSSLMEKILVAFVCIYTFFFAASWGPCAWVVTGELYPLVLSGLSNSGYSCKSDVDVDCFQLVVELGDQL